MRAIIWILTVFLIPIAISQMAWASVAVEILDMPETALVYTPTFVTFSVQNVGKDAIVLPLNENSLENGWFVEVSDPNKHVISFPEDSMDRFGDSLIWLQSGEKRLLSYQIGEELRGEGVYEVRVVVHSTGRCFIAGNQRTPFAMKNVETHGEQGKSFECWSGEWASQVTKIAVYEPAISDDRRALEYVLSGEIYAQQHRPEFARFDNVLSKFANSYQELKGRFPQSYYTYVAGFYAASVSFGQPALVMQEMMQLQPHHALSKYIKAQWALEKIRASNDKNELNGIMASVDDAPEAVKQYVAQEKSDKERSLH